MCCCFVVKLLLIVTSGHFHHIRPISLITRCIVLWLLFGISVNSHIVKKNNITKSQNNFINRVTTNTHVFRKMPSVDISKNIPEKNNLLNSSISEKFIRSVIDPLPSETTVAPQIPQNLVPNGIPLRKMGNSFRETASTMSSNKSLNTNRHQDLYRIPKKSVKLLGTFNKGAKMYDAGERSAHSNYSNNLTRYNRTVSPYSLSPNYNVMLKLNRTKAFDNETIQSPMTSYHSDWYKYIVEYRYCNFQKHHTRNKLAGKQYQAGVKRAERSLIEIMRSPEPQEIYPQFPNTSLMVNTSLFDHADRDDNKGTIHDDNFDNDTDVSLVSWESANYTQEPEYNVRKGKMNVIYIHGLFEISGGDCRTNPEGGVFELKAALAAIQHVNEKRIIPGYQLEMYDNDTKCDSGVAVDSFFHALYRQPIMTMMLGPGSSEVTERLARVVSRWNVIQVSYGAMSPALSDRKNFPFFFRTVAPDASHNPALLAFVQYFKWDTVATLHEQGDKHALPMNMLVSALEQSNISVTLTKGVSRRDYKEHLQELKAQDCRILIGSFSYSLIRKVFCHVYHLKMFGDEYVWILQGDLQESWWDDPSDTECTKQEMSDAAKGVITVSSHYGLHGNVSTTSGIDTADLLRQIGYRTDPRTSAFVRQTYDAVWAMALALKETREKWLNEATNFSLGDFSYRNYRMAEDMANVLGSLRFMGISGPVSFHNSDRVGYTSFRQNQGGTELSLVCLHYPDSDELNFNCEGCVTIEWQGGRVPIARRIIRLRIAVLDRRVLICITSLAVFGVILALTFLTFNLCYRKFKFIKLSSPNLNNFVIVGCILVYVAMILLGMDHGSLVSDNHFSFVCSSRAFLLSGGFSLAFGCMFIKTYRVYHIFIRSSTGIVKSKLLHDRQLLAMVSVLVLIDCFIVTLWVTLDPMERELRNLTMQVNPSERNVVYLYQREQCTSSHMAKWLGSLYIYKGLLLVVGCYMAWETRHVKIPALNDSQYIGMSVYNVVIASTIIVALANVIPVERYTLTFVLVSVLIFVSTTMTLCLLFVPKIHTIFANSDIDGAVVATPGVKVECKTRRFEIDEPKESMYRAEVLNRVLRRELLELEEELSKLSAKCGIIPPGACSLLRHSLIEQEEDSDDDDLPPWLSEYKRYPRNSSEGIWYSSGQEEPNPRACFSVLGAHPLFMPAVGRSWDIEVQPLRPQTPPDSNEEVSKTDAPVKKTFTNAMRCSLPSMTFLDCRPQKRHLTAMDFVRSCGSDRSLDNTRRPQTPFHSRVVNWSLSKLNAVQNSHPFKDTERPVSERKLITSSVSRLHNFDAPLIVRPSSLRKVSSLEGSHSIVSDNTTSCESDWNTAPLYSSSFATAGEDSTSSSNNQTLVTPSETPDLKMHSNDSSDSNGYFFSKGDTSSNSDNLPYVDAVNHVPNCCNNNKSIIEGSASRIQHQSSHCLGRTEDEHSHGCVHNLTNSLSSLNESGQLDSCCSVPSGFLSDARNNLKFDEGCSLKPSNRCPTVKSNRQEVNSLVSCTDVWTNSSENSFHSAANSSSSSFTDAESNTDEILADQGTPTSTKTLLGSSTSSDDIFLTEEAPTLVEESSSSDSELCNPNSDMDESFISSTRTSGTNETTCIVPSGPSSNAQSSRNQTKSLADSNEFSDTLCTDLTPCITVTDTSDSLNSDLKQTQCDSIKRQIFQLERDLILLELDTSESVDL